MFILSQIKNIFRTKPKIIVVLGQTSTGKSDIAVAIAKKNNGEIISADSRQVYRGMDLGSGKITVDEMQGVPHHLLDVIDPHKIFSVQDFQNLGKKAITEIIERGCVPIICGGTGFYIDSLVQQTEFSQVKPNQIFRKKMADKTTVELADLLKEQSQKIAKKTDLQNPVRIIRALEIINELGYIPKAKISEPYKVLYIGLMLNKQELDERIKKRIVTRLNQGMLDEARSLLEKGLSHQRLQSFGLEYKYMSKHILGELSYEEMIEKLYWDTVHFAKRQKTWFKRNKKVHWFDSFEDKTNMHELIKSFLK